MAHTRKAKERIGKPEVKRSRVRRESKWEDNIKEMIHACKGTQRIYLPKDTGQ
jgi:hypothetical protein